MYDDAPSFGETRAADPALSPPPSRYPVSASGVDRGSTVSAQATRSSRTGPVSGANQAGGRFCGVCGARIVGTETFCGQCGSPVQNPSGAGRPGSQPGPTGRYQVGPSAGWDDDDRNAYTEALPETPTMAAARNPYAADPYARSFPPPQYGSRGATPEPQTGGMTRSTRITLGVIFLAVSIVLALGAIAVLTVGR